MRRQMSATVCHSPSQLVNTCPLDRQRTGNSSLKAWSLGFKLRKEFCRRATCSGGHVGMHMASHGSLGRAKAYAAARSAAAAIPPARPQCCLASTTSNHESWSRGRALVHDDLSHAGRHSHLLGTSVRNRSSRAQQASRTFKSSSSKQNLNMMISINVNICRGSVRTSAESTMVNSTECALSPL